MSKMTALILVDLQNDFLPGGALAVPEGNQTIAIANSLLPDFDIVVATQDWHPPNHGSFASNHEGKSPYEQIDLHGHSQTLWPIHCVQNSGGALFAPDLNTSAIDRVFPKGQNPKIDSYSGFFDNDRRQSTGMGEWLQDQSVHALTILGLATDYCVKFTVLDALAEGFKVSLHLPGCRGVNLRPGDVDRSIAEMEEAGTTIVGKRET